MKTTIKVPYAAYAAAKKNYNSNSIYPAIDAMSVDAGLFMVCGGLGGLERGHEAANIVMQHFSERITNSTRLQTERLGQLVVNDVLRFSERRLQTFAKNNPEMNGLASSIALLYFNFDGSITVAWAGDSRVYQIRRGRIIYCTEDHMVHTKQNDKDVLVPRALSGVEPAWASLSIITDIQADDYFLLTTPELYRSISDKDMAFLLEQGDGNDATNQALSNKMTELVKAKTDDSFSHILLQVNDSPFEAGNSNGFSQNLNKLHNTGPLFDRKIDDRPSGRFNIDLGQINNWFKTLNIKVIGGIVGLLALAVIGFTLLNNSNVGASPEELNFKAHLNEANGFMMNGNYEAAIISFEQALAVNVEDSLAKDQIKTKIEEANTELTMIEGGTFYKDGLWQEALIAYQKVLDFDAQNAPVSQKVDELTQLLNQKKILVQTADSLKSNYKCIAATRKLYEALELDKRDLDVLSRINACNKALKKDTLTLEQAVAIVNDNK